jgi:hypothetical protein
VHCVPHHQEKAGKTEILYDSQLVLDLRGLLVVDLAPSLTRALVNFLAQERVVVVARRNGKFRQRRTNPRQIEIAFGGDAFALLDTLLPTFPSLRHLLRRDETPLAVRMKQSPRDGVIDRGVVAQ